MLRCMCVLPCCWHMLSWALCCLAEDLSCRRLLAGPLAEPFCQPGLGDHDNWSMVNEQRAFVCLFSKELPKGLVGDALMLPSHFINMFLMRPKIDSTARKNYEQNFWE